MNSCLICLENTNIYAIPICKCKYNIHKECINIWLQLNNTCIICKSKLLTYQKYTKFNYIDKEFENSKIFDLLELLLNKLTYYSNFIENITIKIILFNGFFAFLLFMMFMPIFLLKLVISQIKYILDNYILDKYQDKNIYNSTISFYKIKN